MSSETNTVLTRWGTAINASGRMFTRSAVSVGAGVAASCAVVPSMVSSMIPTSLQADGSALTTLLDAFKLMNSFLPIAEAFFCLSLLILTKNILLAWSIFRATVKTQDDANPLG